MSDAVLRFDGRKRGRYDVGKGVEQFIVGVVELIDEVDGIRCDAVSEGGGEGIEGVQIQQHAVTVIRRQVKRGQEVGAEDSLFDVCDDELECEGSIADCESLFFRAETINIRAVRRLETRAIWSGVSLRRSWGNNGE